MESSPLGQREAARRTLQEQGVDIISNAFVTRVEAGEQPPMPEASTSDSGRRVVHLKLPGEQQQVISYFPLAVYYALNCPDYIGQVAQANVRQQLPMVHSSTPSNSMRHCHTGTELRRVGSYCSLLGVILQVLQADLVLWTAGSGPVSKEGVGEGALKLPFPANDKGAVRTDATLRVVDHPRVFALGDVSGCDAEASTSAPSLAPTAQVCCQTLLCTYSPASFHPCPSIWSAVIHAWHEIL